MKSVITGGLGFIGKHLVHKLKELGHQVVLFPREWSELPEFDYLFHLAAYGNKYDQTDEEEIYKSNLELTWRLLQASKKIQYKGFINFSSSSTLLSYETLYSATKGGGERLCKAFATKHNRPVVSIRPFSVYGPQDDPKHFIPVAIKAFKENLELKVSPGDHDWIYIDDLISGVLKVVENIDKLRGESINIGTGTSVSNYGIISILQDIFQKHGFVKRVNQIREYDTKHWVADIAILRSLGWEPELDIEDGLQRCIYGYSE